MMSDLQEVNAKLTKDSKKASKENATRMSDLQEVNAKLT